jgi:voltage-gated potassium channel
MATTGPISHIHTKILWSFVSLGTVLTTGTFGYWLLGDREYSLLDCFYMTIITISTIGFTEVVDLSDNPYGRLFTVFIAMSGIGTFAYLLSNFTASVVEGELNEVFRRKKMEKRILQMKDHFIVCGIEGVGEHIMGELQTTERPFVLVDSDRTMIEDMIESFPNQLFVEGDATDNDIQIRAGIERAQGLFAATGDDNRNLVITLTSKQLNPKVKVVARCREHKNVEKMKKAGADDVVMTNSIGGLRMASVMIRPAVVSFLDVMLRDNTNLRVEEMRVPETLLGSPLSDLELGKYPGILLLAVRRSDDWLYNPPRSYKVGNGDTLIFMASPEQRGDLAKLFTSRT